MKNLKLLNLGCGNYFHEDWVNIDFVETGKGVIAYNLLKGIPFDNNSFDMVYHSHVLEHFTKEQGFFFIQECYRVLKPEGVIRIAVPDLEQIAKNYLHFLEDCSKNASDKVLDANYEWTLLEMYDQTTRNYVGGEMGKYLKQDMLNKNFVLSRIGQEVNPKKSHITTKTSSKLKKLFSIESYRNFLKKIILTKTEKEYLEIGRFRSSGEIHQQMYDKYSLQKLLEKIGFKNFVVRKVHESYASSVWQEYNLDIENGEARKPDSIFVEAIK